MFLSFVSSQVFLGKKGWYQPVWRHIILLLSLQNKTVDVEVWYLCFVTYLQYIYCVKYFIFKCVIIAVIYMSLLQLYVCHSFSVINVWYSCSMLCFDLAVYCFTFMCVICTTYNWSLLRCTVCYFCSLQCFIRAVYCVSLFLCDMGNSCNLFVSYWQSEVTRSWSVVSVIHHCCIEREKSPVARNCKVSQVVRDLLTDPV